MGTKKKIQSAAPPVADQTAPEDQVLRVLKVRR